MPFWKIDKYVRKLVGPNPFKAHDVIGAKGSNFLTWSCLHHLTKNYQDLFEPARELIAHKESGQNWYPLNHLRPIVNWTLNEKEYVNFQICIYGQLFQMASLLLHEKRSSLVGINAIGEICAQFRNGILATIRNLGSDQVISIVNEYHNSHDSFGKKCWYPDVFSTIESKEWQQLYVNAEHDGKIGVVTIGRESYNHDVNAELNRALDWLKNEKINKVIVTGDFHIATQMVGADTSDFYEALENEEVGYSISFNWSKTARRLHNDFEISVGFINGKRCLGGFLELLAHCHFLVAHENTDLGMPEVTLPVVPGMEGCHWPFRKTDSQGQKKLLSLLLEGTFVKAKETQGWLCDYTGSFDDALKKVWEIITNNKHGINKRDIITEKIDALSFDLNSIKLSENSEIEAGRKAIFQTIRECLSVDLNEALTLQSKMSADFMMSKDCKKGRIGLDFMKNMNV